MNNFLVCFKTLGVTASSAIILCTSSAVTQVFQNGTLLTNSLDTTEENITISKDETQFGDILLHSIQEFSKYITEATLPNNIEKVGCITTPSGLQCW